MRALTQKCRYINLSLAFDTLTIYRNFSEEDKTLEESIDDAIDSMKDLENFHWLVQRNEDDHSMYHQDEFSIDPENIAEHWHVKMSNTIELPDLENLLTKLVQHELLNDLEMKNFIAAFMLRFETSRKKFDDALIGEINQDTSTIINLIKNCDDNAILIDWHRYLVTGKFDYLREVNVITNFWQTKIEKNLIETSETWAMIEKSLSLQIAMNIKQQTKFNKAVAEDRAGQFEENLSFFSIKRQHNEQKKSKFFNTFISGQENELESLYEKHFEKMSPTKKAKLS